MPSRQEWKCALDKNFLEDLTWWVREQRRVALRLLEIMEQTLRDPENGIGKPERLRHMGPGLWSRRLTQEHRVVYLVKGDTIVFLMARYHYE